MAENTSNDPKETDAPQGARGNMDAALLAAIGMTQDNKSFPVEMAAAFFPFPAKCGEVVMHPPTLAHVAALNMVGCYWDKDSANEETAILAAWILSHDSENLSEVFTDADGVNFNVWLATRKPNGADLVGAVSSLLNIAFSPIVEGSGKNFKMNMMPSGYGWPLEIAERACADYGWTFAQAIHTPLVQIFALSACRAKRNGKEAGPDYYARRFIGEIKKAKA